MVFEKASRVCRVQGFQGLGFAGFAGFRVSKDDVKSYEKLRFLTRPAGFVGFKVSRVWV